MAVEILSAQSFVMYDNFYLETYEWVANIHKRPLNQCVEMEGFQLYSTTGYHDKHNIIEIISRALRISACEISVRLGFYERVPVPGSNMILTVIWMNICGLASETVHHVMLSR